MSIAWERAASRTFLKFSLRSLFLLTMCWVMRKREPTPVSRVIDPPIFETAWSSICSVRETSGLRPAPPESTLKRLPEVFAFMVWGALGLVAEWQMKDWLVGRSFDC